MKFTLGPKTAPTMASLIFGYRGHGKRWGKIMFANGFTLRAGSVALHIWKPRGNALGSGVSDFSRFKRRATTKDGGNG